jgi:hypothetical protein
MAMRFSIGCGRTTPRALATASASVIMRLTIATISGRSAIAPVSTATGFQATTPTSSPGTPARWRAILPPMAPTPKMQMRMGFSLLGRVAKIGPHALSSIGMPRDPRDGQRRGRLRLAGEFSAEIPLLLEPSI